MSTEQLLKPRYKVIADYFYNPYKIGDIITVLYDDRSVHLTTTSYRDEFGETVDQANYFHPKRLNDFPHLFKPLAWWEEREEKDMPKYIRYNKTVYSVSSWDLDNGQLKCAWDGERILPMQPHCLPATESEYNEYLKQSKK